MKLTAGLLTYNSETFTDPCLASLLAQETLGELQKDWQIVLLDNASNDRISLTRLEKRYPQITVIKSEKNLGFSKGHNRIIREFPAEFHAVLNIDVLFSPNYLYELLHALQMQERFGSATGKLLRWDIASNNPKTNIIDSTGIEMSDAHAFQDRAQGEEDQGQYSMQEECFGASGAAALYRRSALEDVAMLSSSEGARPLDAALEESAPESRDKRNTQQFFDERMFMYKEDIDLAYRLKNANHPCVYVPTAIAWHARTTAVSRKRRSRQERIYSTAHEALLLRKQRLNWTPQVRLKTLLRQFGRWCYLLVLEPRTFFGARRVLKNIFKT